MLNTDHAVGVRSDEPATGRTDMLTKAIFALIPVIGAVILFAAWVVQQTLLERANSSLQQIYAAENTFQTYQSNNALFNAIARLPDAGAGTQDYIRTVQIYNYELGLRDMEALLGDSERQGIPGSVNAYSGMPPLDQKMEIVQERLTKIQGAVANQKERIAVRKASLNRKFFVLYALGSIVVLVGSVLNVVRTNA